MWPQYIVIALIIIRFIVSLDNLAAEWPLDKNTALGVFIAATLWNAGILFVLDAGGFFDKL